MKNFLFLLVTAFGFNCIHAQVYFGIRAGANVGNLYRTTDSGQKLNYEYTPGIDAAAVLNIGITYSFSIQPEIHYIQKGFTDNFSNDSKSITKLNFVELQTLAKYFVGNDVLGLTIGAGPFLGYGLNGELRQDGFSETFPVTDFDISILDFGGIGAIGIEYFMGDNLIVFDARYLYGLLNLSIRDENNIKANSRGISCGLTYFF